MESVKDGGQLRKTRQVTVPFQMRPVHDGREMDRLSTIVASPGRDDQAKPPRHVLDYCTVADDAIYSGCNKKASVN
jgi:hypothetical protein